MREGIRIMRHLRIVRFLLEQSANIALSIHQEHISVRISDAAQALFRMSLVFLLFSIKLKLLESMDLAGQMQENPLPAKGHTFHWALVNVLRNIACNLQVR
jgi:hypothetical protein